MSIPALQAFSLTFPVDQGHQIFLLVSKSLLPLVDTPGAPWNVIVDTSEDSMRKPSGWRKPIHSLFKTFARAKNIADDLSWDSSTEPPKPRQPFDVAISLTRKVPHALAFARLGIRERYVWNQPELKAFGRPTVAVEQLTRASDPGKVDQVRYFLEMAKWVFEHQMKQRGDSATWPPAVLSPTPRLEFGRQYFHAHFQSACSKLLKHVSGRGVSTGEHGRQVKSTIEELMNGKRRYFLVASTSSAKSSIKRWPLESFFQVATTVASHRKWVPVFTFGSSQSERETWHELEERISAAQVNEKGGSELESSGLNPENESMSVNSSGYSVATIPPILSFPPGAISLAELLAIIDSSQFVFTNDTGPRHMSLALGIRTVTLFGPSPTSRAVHALHLERPIKLHDECHSTCSLKNNFCRYAGRSGDPCLCLRAITPAMVNSQIEDFVPNEPRN